MINLNETERLNKLLNYRILDTPEESDFDELVHLASSICKTPISLVSLLDDKRQWFKARHGLDVKETPKEVSFCQHAIKDEKLFIVNDALLDPRFENNPLVKGFPDIRFYAGMPLTTTDGFNLGTLCVIDVVPRILNEEQKEALKIISKQVTKQLDLKLSYYKEKELNSILQLKQAELIEVNNAKDRLFSIVAHDLRTPLRNIQTIMELYNGGDVEAHEIGSFMTSLTAKVKDTTEMIENLLSWAKAQISNNQLLFSEFDISQIIDNECVRNIPPAKQKGITIINKATKSILVNNDSEMITVVIRNLLSNAIKFCTNGDTITLDTEINDNNVIVRVIDTGKGISEENLAKIFSNAQNISTYGTNKEKGVGIGLNLCKTFLNKSNGNIWVESEENKGSTFSFSIPIKAE